MNARFIEQCEAIDEAQSSCSAADALSRLQRLASALHEASSILKLVVTSGGAELPAARILRLELRKLEAQHARSPALAGGTETSLASENAALRSELEDAEERLRVAAQTERSLRQGWADANEREADLREFVQATQETARNTGRRLSGALHAAISALQGVSECHSSAASTVSGAVEAATTHAGSVTQRRQLTRFRTAVEARVAANRERFVTDMETPVPPGSTLPHVLPRNSAAIAEFVRDRRDRRKRLEAWLAALLGYEGDHGDMTSAESLGEEFPTFRTRGVIPVSEIAARFALESLEATATDESAYPELGFVVMRTVSSAADIWRQAATSRTES